jgi:hypothetical protein
MLSRAAAVWFGIMLIAIANGALRIFVIVPLTGEAIGHIVSTLFLCLFVVFAVGSLWLGLKLRRELGAE